MIIIKILLFFAPCFAQLANYNSIILGDRSAGMGGAGTALLNDSSSAAFFNPGLLSQSTGTAFSAAVGIYKKYDTEYGKESDYTKTPLKVSSGFFRSLPSSTASLIRKNNLTFGLSILVPEYETFKGDLTSTTTNTSSLTYTDETLWVGGTISHNFNNTSSWGLTLYYTARNFLRTIQDRTYPDATSTVIFNSDEAITENAIVPIFGFLQRLENGINLGVSYRFNGIPVSTSAKYFESTTDTGNGGSSTTIDRSDLQSNIVIPGKFSIGISKTFEGDLTLSGNVDSYDGANYNMISIPTTPAAGTTVIRNPVKNISLGAEKGFFEWLKIRVGVFSNFSPYPNPDPSLHRLQGERVDSAGFSANAVFIAENKIAYTFGGYYNGGRGRAMERIDQNYTILTKSQQVFTMLIGTHFYF